MALSNVSVLVTGAAQGVGRGIALAAAAAGAAVTVTARRIEAAQKVADEITARGHKGFAVTCDVTSRTSVEQAIAATVAHFGTLTALIHNAVSPQSSVPVPIEKIDAAHWDEQIAVALRGTYYCAQAALPHLQAAKGSFVLLTSNGGIEGSVTLPVYGTTKAAQRGFVKSLAREWGPLGVRVNAVSPVAMTAAMENFFKLQPDKAALINGRAALGRLGDPETDIGRATAFLLGPDSAFVSGQTLMLTGGAFML
jgi:NAD(P)-dependent dehydrogenase (short-subunit alcohol dehydrogenase family)